MFPAGIIIDGTAHLNASVELIILIRQHSIPEMVKTPPALKPIKGLLLLFCVGR
jgi:hypothetical protein